jgi:putative beta-lysine N-acetyltransferase
MDIATMANNGDLIIDRQNRRIKVLRYDAHEIERLQEEIKRLAEEEQASKLIIYAKKKDVAAFVRLGYRQEGKIDGFFRGENAQMLAYFLTEERAVSAAPELADEIVRLSLSKAEAAVAKRLPAGYHLRPAGEADAEELAQLYAMVFATYPTPMDDPEYVRKTMRESTYYYVIVHEGRIACAASAEVSERFGSAELTDCATHPDHLGKGLLQPLFAVLEEKMKQIGIHYLYTLTRAQSQGMNVTAAKHGYLYRGRLINNCTIYSGFEDMNIWVKPLKPTWE